MALVIETSPGGQSFDLRTSVWRMIGFEHICAVNPQETPKDNPSLDPEANARIAELEAEKKKLEQELRHREEMMNNLFSFIHSNSK